MGTSDISRNAFDPKKHYASVRMQQGRVMLDDDWNENERIRLYEQLKIHKNIIGDHGTGDDGFRIIPKENLPMGNVGDFRIGKGNYYIGGLLVGLDKNEDYLSQDNWLQQHNNQGNSILVSEGQNAYYSFVYLEAWQQTVTAVEDDELFEKALAGPDTSVRVRTMHRVRIRNSETLPDCVVSMKEIREKWEQEHNCMLTVDYSGENEGGDLCSPAAGRKYLGAENQAIRVQITGNNKFTWGYDNASPLYRITVDEKPGGIKLVTMVTPPKDQYHWPEKGQVVEILPRSAVLSNGERLASVSGSLGKVVSSYDPDTGQFMASVPFAATENMEWDSGQKPAYFYLRVWNRGMDTESSAEFPVLPGQFTDLKYTGLKIRISGSSHVAGDYWIIAARPETPDRVVPWILEKGTKPQGIEKFFAPLAVIQWKIKNKKIVSRVLKDCRNKFPALNHITADDVWFDNSVCHFNLGAANTVQKAIDALCRRHSACTLVVMPGDNLKTLFEELQAMEHPFGIHVCFHAGEYLIENTIALKNMKSVRFAGMGEGTQILVKKNETAFSFEKCDHVSVSDLSFTSQTAGFTRTSKNRNLNGTLTMKDCPVVSLRNISARCAGYDVRAASCLTVRYSESVSPGSVLISNCFFYPGINQTAVLVVNAGRVYAEANEIHGAGDHVSSAASQGMVVAGIVADNVTIIHNQIDGVTQGIHIGTSRSENKPGNPVSAGSVNIADNYIGCFSLTEKEPGRERHGIFIGNANSVSVTGNYLEFAPGTGKSLPVEGIRIYGYLGKKVIVQHNHLMNFPTTRGIYLHPLNPEREDDKKFKPLWIVKENVASVKIAPDKKSYVTENSNFA